MSLFSLAREERGREYKVCLLKACYHHFHSMKTCDRYIRLILFVCALLLSTLYSCVAYSVYAKGVFLCVADGSRYLSRLWSNRQAHVFSLYCKLSD